MTSWILIAAAGLGFGALLRPLTPKLVRVTTRPPFPRPWLELFSCGVFLAMRAGLDGEALVIGLLLAALLVAVTATDLLTKLIPDLVTYPGTLLGIAVSVILPAWICGQLHHEMVLEILGQSPDRVGALVLSLAGAGVGFTFLEVFRRVFGHVARMEVMGMGDSKLLLMMGAFLGPELVLLSFLPSALCGIAFGLWYTKVKGSPHFPFGPALAAGGLATMLFSGPIVGVWAASTRAVQNLGAIFHFAVTLVLLACLYGLMRRVRRRAGEYARLIDEDYASLDEEADESQSAPELDRDRESTCT